MAETKVSLAVNQLGDQVKESKQFWREFRGGFLTEVKNIKPYVGMDLLQQIWRKKVEFNNKDKHGNMEDGQQFVIQIMKLESCLDQVFEATRLLEEARPSDRGSDYDSQQRHIAKICGVGDTVVSLGLKASTNESSCRDLLEELAELEKLISSKTGPAGMPHRIDKRQPQHDAGLEEGNSEEDPTPDREGDGDVHNEQDDPDNWPGNGEENIN
ncbi:hypothetical protein ONZ43_g1801 [Nemania bipapillata]|uniref:Uncharacterized protein n=1 Tax=Nemania bipapillata TaxID=110536 RepID=A0ACC2J2Z5_9PEZI|nr:hypothetical protein ONZ43_g1801 [Nemania bipapillata]